MTPHPTRQHHLLYVFPQTHHIVNGIVMTDADDVLINDRTGIQLLGYIMTGRTNQFYATLCRLMVGFRANILIT